MGENIDGSQIAGKLKNIFIGKAKTLQDKSIFHKLSLVAFFAWIGLGADGISSSCYGPEEAFRNLSGHPMLPIRSTPLLWRSAGWEPCF